MVYSFRGICSTDQVALQVIEQIIPALAKAYLDLYKKQEKQFFGLRDYYRYVTETDPQCVQ